ncbi:M14 family metallopeptidase [Roseateles sp.]|uniref:M14 family metallopeptidase n=1 Tax=Roseateles sp. TaxID=1971397 RepID=UPI0025DB2CEA|nr:M14 family metallopeptidase [Roseateles sp.]MBV8035390.1 succinylglutamate desuccinylase/aspartoacylase family protein [Roseateles sp.]
MQTQFHDLPAASAGTFRRLRSLHFGRGASGRKAYLQAALHADEVPPLLVAQKLATRLAALDDAGAIMGEIVLVPMANPIGLAQDLQGSLLGRFDLGSGVNFNRQFRHLTPALIARLSGRLSPDAKQNTRTIRACSHELLTEWLPTSETEALKHLLQTLAHDADLVLDLHCDNQAVVHLYTGTAQAEAFAPLAAYLSAQALLTSEVSGDEPFDESASRIWWELSAHFGEHFPIDPHSCLAATVELRGETDVSHELAEQDAEALLNFLRHLGHIDGAAPALPPSCPATPLEGVEPVTAPAPGIVVFAKAPGDWVEAGELVAEIIDPLTDARTALHASVSGRCFARSARRYATRGMRLAKIAGAKPFRSGKLLSM